jgi:hypothetical protein
MASYSWVTILKTHDPSKPNFVGIKPKVITAYIYLFIEERNLIKFVGIKPKDDKDWWPNLCKVK